MAKKWKPLANTVKLTGVTPGTKEYKNLYRRVRGMQKRGYIFSEKVPVSPATNLYEVSAYVDQTSGILIKGTVRLQQERAKAARKGWESRRRNALRESTDEAERVALLSNAHDLDNILANIKHKIDNWEGKVEWTIGDDKKGKGETFTQVKKRDKDHLKSLLDNAIATEGVEAVARRLEANADEANILAEQILYGGSGSSQDSHAYMQGELAQFAQLLKGRELTLDEKMELEQQIESFMPA